MSVEVEAAILKIRAELSGDALKQVGKELKKLGLTVAKTGKDGSESLVKIDKDSLENKHLICVSDIPISPAASCTILA